MSCNRFSIEEYALYALGSLEEPERDLLRGHLSAHCQTCLTEIKSAVEFWYLFAALTERTQAANFPQASPGLRDKVIGVARPHTRIFGSPQRFSQRFAIMRIAAGILIAASAGLLSWDIGRIQMKGDIASAQVRVDQQISAVRKLEADNVALRNLVVAARNAPAGFPGKENVVSVQDPYLLRDLQQSKQSQIAISQALTEERTKAADLEKRLSQTSSLLASATHDKEDADRQYRKAYETANLEKARGLNQFSSEIATYKSKVHDLEAEVARYRAVVDSQNKGAQQHMQMISMLQSPNVTMVQLHATDAKPQAHGVVLVAGNSQLAFFPVNLPQARSGHTYQLWLIRDKGPAVVSAGTFDSSSKQEAAVQFSNKALLSGIKSIAVTEEPSGGSALPTGHKLMIGTFKG